MADWKDYTDNRLISDNGWFYTIKPIDSEENIPLNCSICSSLTLSSDDVLTFDLFGCCSWCADQWAYKNADRWREGWRPQQEEIELSLQGRLSKNIVI